jgi:hypothetical protein
MLPQAYQLPAAILLVLGGALACFAGYRLFRVVLGIYGFILGAMIASSAMGISNSIGMVLAAIIGGIAGAVVLMFAYFVGIALVGAGAGALVAHLIWTRVGTGDPPAVAIVIVSIVGAIGAMLLQRYVIISGTAFAGAWTVIVGGVAVAASRGAIQLPSGDVWILYPLTPAPGHSWLPFAWVALGMVGTGVQLVLTPKKRRA